MKKTKFKKLLLLMTVWFLTGNVMANPISVDDAMLRAKKFVSSNTARRIKGNINLSLAYSMTDSLSTLEETVLYAFNINDGNGFVIVSGDDVAKPILGYCDSGSFDADNIPVNMKAWLNSYAEEIAWAKTKASNIENNDLLIPKKAKTTIGALVPSRWDQLGPYCDQCVFNGMRYATGCVATAMAQIMYYWAVKGVNGETFPCGSKALPSYTTNSGLTIDALDKVDSFDWSNMINDLMTTSVTSANKAAVAQLMRYCGQSIKTMYGGPGGSGADTRDVIPALRDIFGFSTNMTLESISYVESINQEALNWNDMIYKQLLDGKPVLMACGSHAFICDGYDENTGKYHFNWGWDGSFDGWYEMNSSNVNNTVNLKYEKEAIINIQPEKREQYAVLSADRSTLTFYFDCDKDSREGTVFDIREDFDTQNWWVTSTKHQGWYGIKTITDVVFDESFGKALPKNTSHWFEELRGLVNISNLELLNTSCVTDMSCMFAGCYELPFLDLRHLDTSNVTDMSGMFKSCLKLETILIGDDYRYGGYDIKSSFNTANVTNMRGMFLECQSLRYVNISYLNTDKVTNMSSMFSGCLKLPLKELGVEGLYTHNVTNMSGMFAGCFLPDYNDYEYWYDFPTVDLDLSFFDTSNVTDMNGMFAYCDLLSSINMSSFNTSKVSNMSGMFSYCNHLYELNVSNFDTSNVTDMSEMFSNCRNLSNLDVSNFITSKVSNMRGMFSDCSSITELNVSNFDTSNVTDMSNMFSSCSRLSNLDVSNFITSKVSNMSDMFSYCSGITELDVSNFETSKVTNMSRLFSGCSGLSELNVSSFDMSKAQSSSNIFTNCKKLNTLYIPASISALSNSSMLLSK